MNNPSVNDLPAPQPPDARAIVLDLLESVLDRRLALDDALDAHLSLAMLESRDRAFARNLVATILRRLGQIDALIAHCLETDLPARSRRVRDILRLGTAQLVFLATPAHAAVTTSVDLAESHGLRGMKGLVNAVLRRISREGAALIAAQDEARLNTPDWLWDSWTASYGEATTRAIALAHLKEAPLDLTPRADPEKWATLLEGVLLPTGTIRREAGGMIPNLPGYAEGAWWVQDAAATLPAKLMGDVDGHTVIDLCAAPGGKTAQLAAAGAHVIAVDRSKPRVERLKTNLARLSFSVDTVVADGATWRPAEKAGFILLDAPCSATGTIRRHPDLPHLKNREDVTRLGRTQERLLAAAVDMLAPGGTLIYCSCSLEPEEGVGQIEGLLGRGLPIKRKPIQAAEIGGFLDWLSPAGDLRTLPCHLPEQGGIDGFYAARLIRTA